MLKVMTLNINYYGDKHGPWSVRKELVRDAIQAAQPDIIAFQAVRMDPAVNHGVDQAAQLAELLPEFKFRLFQDAMHTDDGGTHGSAVLSCIEIARTDCVELSLRPGLDDTNHRSVLHVQFDVAGAPFHLFNAHFSWVTEQALDNVKEVLPVINAAAGRVMLVGDLNTTPDGEPMQLFRNQGWTDVWAALYPGQDGFTFFEGGRWAKRIDYAWVNAELRPEIQAIDIVAKNQDAEGAQASDHAGLLITLSTPA